mmetsp:Transcript_47002/g.114685  ORF Transcript_47002/g.114685 Transcript_47002/m.114685 type:complete len:423 (+) Transcript_47002:103-1371(+)
MSTYDDQVDEVIPGMIYMFAGAEDSQQAFDVSSDADGTFELPDPAGRSGGACTSAFLQALWRDDDDDEGGRYTWAETIALMRDKIEEIGLSQVPQLSTSKPIDIHEEICITAPPENDDDYDDEEYEAGSGGGTKRAMLIGLNYTGEDNALTSCHNDVRNMKDFLMSVHGFERQNMLILMDDGQHHEPTKQLIMDSFTRLCQISQPGDSIFIQFSGHGGQITDRSGDEKDKKDEALIPGDYKEAGHILDDEIYAEFVTQVPAGVHVVCMMDCCHSGSAMDLPYICDVGDEQLRYTEGFNLIPATAATTGGTKKKTTKKKGKGKKEKDGKDGKKEKKKKGDKKKSADKDKGEKEKGKKKKGPKKKATATDDDDDDDDEGDEDMEDPTADSSKTENDDDNGGKQKTKKKRGGLFGGGLLGRKGKK